MKKYIAIFILLLSSIASHAQESFHQFESFKEVAISSNVIFIITRDEAKDDYVVSSVIAGTPDIRKIQTLGQDPKWKEVVRSYFMRKPESFKWPQYVVFFQKEIPGCLSYENQGVSHSGLSSSKVGRLSPIELVDFIKKTRNENN